MLFVMRKHPTFDHGIVIGVVQDQYFWEENVTNIITKDLQDHFLRSDLSATVYDTGKGRWVGHLNSSEFPLFHYTIDTVPMIQCCTAAYEVGAVESDGDGYLWFVGMGNVFQSFDAALVELTKQVEFLIAEKYVTDIFETEVVGGYFQSFPDCYNDFGSPRPDLVLFNDIEFYYEGSRYPSYQKFAIRKLYLELEV